MMDTNPYQAPAATAPPPVPHAGADAHAIRVAHIKHEASVKSIGILYYLAVIGLSLGALGAIPALIEASGNLSDVGKAGETVGEVLVLSVICGGMAILYGFVGRGIRTLKPWARVAGIVLSCIGLLGFPLGTLINAYILWLLASKKGATVFSPEYKAVIAATPDVKYKTSKAVWIILAIVLLVIVGIIVFAISAA